MRLRVFVFTSGHIFFIPSRFLLWTLKACGGTEPEERRWSGDRMVGFGLMGTDMDIIYAACGGYFGRINLDAAASKN